MKWMKISLIALGIAIAAAVFLSFLARSEGWRPDLANTAWGAIVGSIGGALITGIVGVLLRGSIEEDLDKKRGEINRDLQLVIEKSKAENQRELLTYVEREKALIQRQADSYKHELEQMIVSARLRTDKLFQLLPELWSRIVVAHGIMQRWYGLRRGTDWTLYTEEEFEAHIKTSFPKIPKRELDRILMNFKHGNGNIDRELDPLFMGKAEQLISEANNFRIENRLFLPEEVEHHAGEAIKKLHRSLTLVSRDTKDMKGVDADEAAEKHIESLYKAIRQSLDPAKTTFSAVPSERQSS